MAEKLMYKKLVVFKVRHQRENFEKTENELFFSAEPGNCTEAEMVEMERLFRERRQLGERMFSRFENVIFLEEVMVNDEAPIGTGETAEPEEAAVAEDGGQGAGGHEEPRNIATAKHRNDAVRAKRDPKHS